jgi:hypothetical protein
VYYFVTLVALPVDDLGLKILRFIVSIVLVHFSFVRISVGWAKVEFQESRNRRDFSGDPKSVEKSTPPCICMEWTWRNEHNKDVESGMFGAVAQKANSIGGAGTYSAEPSREKQTRFGSFWTSSCEVPSLSPGDRFGASTTGFR